MMSIQAQTGMTSSSGSRVFAEEQYPAGRSFERPTPTSEDYSFVDRGRSQGVDLRPHVYVVLVIPDSLPESRWLPQKPRVGGRIDDTNGRTWRVADVLQSGRQTYTVVCEPSRSGVVPELASDLLDRARNAIALTKRKRRLGS